MPQYEYGFCKACRKYSCYLLPKVIKNKVTGSIMMALVCEDCRKEMVIG